GETFDGSKERSSPHGTEPSGRPSPPSSPGGEPSGGAPSAGPPSPSPPPPPPAALLSKPQAGTSERESAALAASAARRARRDRPNISRILPKGAKKVDPDLDPVAGAPGLVPAELERAVVPAAAGLEIELVAVAGAGDLCPVEAAPLEGDVLVRADAGAGDQAAVGQVEQGDRDRQPGDREGAHLPRRQLVGAAQGDPAHPPITWGFGSKRSRSPSPSRFEPSTTSMIASPGISASRCVFHR